MRFDKNSLLLYLVSDRHWLEGRRLADDLEAAIKGGVTFVQLREKDDMAMDHDDFLKEALLRVPEEEPYRGPRDYAEGDYAYHCETEGSFNWFQGKETISYRGKVIYECFYHGGMIE